MAKVLNALISITKENSHIYTATLIIYISDKIRNSHTELPRLMSVNKYLLC